RRAGARATAGNGAADCVLRTRMGGGVLVVRADGTGREDGERVASARAAVSTLVRALAQLRRAARATALVSARCGHSNERLGTKDQPPTGRVRTHCDSTHFSPDVGGMPAWTVS